MGFECLETPRNSSHLSRVLGFPESQAGMNQNHATLFIHVLDRVLRHFHILEGPGNSKLQVIGVTAGPSWPAGTRTCSTPCVWAMQVAASLKTGRFKSHKALAPHLYSRIVPL